MIAFHGKQEVKDFYVARVRGHREADEIAQGAYYTHDANGKVQACGVGCTIHGANHAAYETELGIPRAVAYLEDRLFEGMPAVDALLWPERFLSAIAVGADLSLVVPRFLVWLLSEDGFNVGQWATPQGRAAIAQVAGLYRHLIDGDTITEADWREARSAASSAAAASSASSAASSAAAYAASSATAAASSAAAYAASSAAAYAYVAADVAAAAAAYAVARSESYLLMADTLVTLLAGAPVAALAGQVGAPHREEGT